MTVSIADLRQFEIFEDYEDEELHETVAPHLTALTFEAGTTICQERAPGDTCFFLVDGDVDVQKVVASGKTEQIGQLAAGTVFGQLVLLDGGNRSATCVARTDCRVLELSRTEFGAMRSQGERLAFDLALGIGRALAGQIRQATENLSAMSESRVEDPHAITQRLERFLRPVSGDSGSTDASSDELKLRDIELK